VVNTLLSTYAEIDAHVGTLTNVQLGIYIIFGVLTAYALLRLIFKKKKTPPEDPASTRGQSETPGSWQAPAWAGLASWAECTLPY
jgi:uncharacterized membrane protein YfcA